VIRDLKFALRLKRVLLIAACLSALGFPFPTRLAAQTVTQVSAGVYHTIFVKSDGSLWGMGDNSQGALGLGAGISNTYLPQQIMSSNVSAISAGNFHSLILESNGSLWATGNNEDGQLGDGTEFDFQYLPEEIRSNQVTGIAAGGFHSLFTTLTPGSRFVLGTYGFWATGADNYGQLGNGSAYGQIDSPEEIQSTELLDDIVTAMAGGYLNSLHVEENGSLWGTGYNEDGELGDGTAINRDSYEEIVSSNVVTVAAGYYHSLFIKSDRSLWAMGADSEGELGDNSTVGEFTPELVGDFVTAVAAGYNFSLFIKIDGSLWGMGANTQGQLGDGTGTNQYLSVLIASDVVAVAAGQNQSFFIKSDGTLWGMGWNADGELGDGTVYTRYSPVQIVPLVIPQPGIANISLANTNLVLSGTNGESGRNYITLMSTNLALPVNQWTSVATNFLATDGAFSITATNAVNPNAAQAFYVLQAQ
jgi:alpha-tubulin suppressor-like RCC1 family protein